MDPIVVDVELTPADWDALQRHLQSRLRKQTSTGDFVLNAALGAVPSLILLYFLSFLGPRIPPFVFLGGLLVVVSCVYLIARRVRRAHRPTARSNTWLPTRFEIDATGLRVSREHQVGVVDWRAIEAVDDTEGHVFLLLDRLLAYVIPKRQIVSMTPEAFVARVRQLHAERRGQGPSASIEPGAMAPASTMSASHGGVSSLHPVSRALGFWSGLRSNLLVGLRAFLFRRSQPADIVSSFDQVVGLLLILLGVVAICDRATAGLDAEFDAYALYTWITLLLIGLWTCALIARTVSKGADTRTLLVVALATAPWVVITSTALSLIPASADSWWYVGAVVAIVVWASVRAVHAAYGTIPRGALIIMALSLMAFATLAESLYLEAHLWTAASDDEEGDGYARPTAQEAEAIFFDQQARVDEAVEKLAPQRPGVSDVYYVGFAGDGYQRVFRREALLGQRIFGERLGTASRSLELVNDYQDRDSFPLATQVSFRYALSEIGKVMDPKEDVLVLFLTSHGSREGGISIRDGVSWDDSDLPPDEVRSALDDAGIRWRIVVVSACYSGVFIEPLKTDTTMIVTAADSQHTSFGCADDRDLTYFGEAFLRDSLPKAASLADAFEQARAAIAAREKQEDLTPSNPQMWVGASMAKKLGALGPLPVGVVATSLHKSLE